MNQPPEPSTKVPPILFLMVTAFLFATGISIVFPVLPYIVAKYVPNVSQQAAMIGLLGASYAFCSFFSSPVLGAFSDAYGRRPIVILSLTGSAIGYLIFGIGGSLWILFLGRIIDGLCAGGMGALFGYLADTTPEKDRGRVFGQIGATVGAGFIVGPAIGGLASHLSLSAPMFLAAGVSLLNVLVGRCSCCRKVLPVSRRGTRTLTRRISIPFKQLSGALSYPAVRRLVTVGVLFAPGRSPSCRPDGGAAGARHARLGASRRPARCLYPGGRQRHRVAGASCCRSLLRATQGTRRGCAWASRLGADRAGLGMALLPVLATRSIAAITGQRCFLLSARASSTPRRAHSSPSPRPPRRRARCRAGRRRSARWRRWPGRWAAGSFTRALAPAQRSARRRRSGAVSAGIIDRAKAAGRWRGSGVGSGLKLKLF